jgi:P27 family predicted phage terminase small subunit
MPQPAKSLELHKLHGTTPGAKNSATQSEISAGRPKFPANLPLDLRATFQKICKLLAERRSLTEADGPLLSLYCVAYDRHQRATEKLRQEGEVVVYTRLDSNGQQVRVEKPNLWLKVAQDAERQMIACLDRLGMSPLNRDKVKPTAGATGSQVAPGSMADIYGADLAGLQNLKPRTLVVPIPPIEDEQ